MKAWEASQQLVEAYRTLEIEAAKLRYKLNFGTARCQNCEGLHAGPGVIATCFQVQRCNFTNVREDNTTPRQLRILESLGQTHMKRS